MEGEKEMKEVNLTEGSVLKNVLRFSLPYLLTCFLQTFYGLADLFITGQFNGASTITAVSIGSQIMHMLTVVIVGLSMGTTVLIGHAVGKKENQDIKKTIGNTVILFLISGLILTILLLGCCDGIVKVLSTPVEAIQETKNYLYVCFVGILFITFYNVISSIFRGLGDSRTPMVFIAISGIINIGLDYILIGPLGMKAFGAALATVIAQALSVIMAYIYARRNSELFKLNKTDLMIEKQIMSDMIKVGFPIAAQNGFIQVSFLVITTIANQRGVEIAAAVGIVEKVISFLFLVPNAMMSSVSAIAAQNAGAGKHERSRLTLYYGIGIGVVSGIFFTILCQFKAESIVAIFAGKEEQVIHYGGQYLRSYVTDCIAASFHFCFSGYFCAYEKAYLSFVHNVISILVIRIPGAYLASVYFPHTLFPMGLAAPLGSVLSAIICILAFLYLNKKK
ncbi:MAG: MATE family efflux transporter, partial [Holdemanella sp.]|nr:MATE family efflux transporter [Holdemanella sp.]